MFESTGLREQGSSETSVIDTLAEECDRRWLRRLNLFFVLPASAMVTFVVVIMGDLTRLMMLPVLCLTYGVLGLPTLLAYDFLVRPARRSFSDYVLLGLTVVREWLWVILVSAVGGLVSLFTSL
jgi:hypothetical protein